MNLKLIYGLIYGFFGFIIACLASAAFYAISSALLWTFVLGDGVWPPWLLLLLAVSFIFVFVFINIKVIAMGMKKGERLDSEDEEYQKENRSRAKGLLKLSVVSLLVFIIFFTFKFGAFQEQLQGVEAVNASEVKISGIELRQKEKLLEVVVGVEGKKEVKHELRVEIIAMGNQDQQIVEIVREVPLTYSHQQFVFPVSFDSLGEQFHAYFSQYVPEMKQKTGIDALFKIVAHLSVSNPVESSEEASPKTEEPQEISQQETLARFFFSCVDKYCVVSQFDKPEEVPTEKYKKLSP